MKFNFDSPEPIYLQVAEQLEEAIFTGIYRAGEQVPSTTEMSKEFHINPATALKGMNRLVAAQ
ncbi:GntR family transcriptional regulator, partial [Levilactobacillus brevis]|nr:GntR family transcriptional regulator [Levilactobacillus brevis]